MSMPSRVGCPRPVLAHHARRSETVSADGPRMLGVPSSAISPAARQPGGDAAPMPIARIGSAVNPPTVIRQVNEMAAPSFGPFMTT
jgi:hypothetical protein